MYYDIQRQRKLLFKINEFMVANEIDWIKCVGVSTNCGCAMFGKITGLLHGFKNIIPLPHDIIVRKIK